VIQSIAKALPEDGKPRWQGWEKPANGRYVQNGAWGTDGDRISRVSKATPS